MIQEIRKEEEQKHALYRPPSAPNRVQVKPLKNGEIIYLIKNGEETNDAKQS